MLDTMSKVYLSSVGLARLAIIVSVLLVVSVSGDVGQAINCKDDNGNVVDWFIAYKLPMDPSSQDPQFQKGSGYFYLTPSQSTWVRSNKDINALDSMIGLTVEPIYGNDTTNDELAYILYNDQPPHPEPPVLYNGHTKGSVLTKSTFGIWLVHSVPHFPKLPSKKQPGQQGYYPPGGLENGQIFLCMSMTTKDIDTVIGDALLYTKPHVYNFNIPSSMNSLIPKLSDIVYKNATKVNPPWFTLSQLKTNGGIDFTVFAKGVKFRKDVYSAWISDKLATSLDVQSWLQGAHPIQSDCTQKYSVYNILNKDITGANFTCHNDHSKWANGIDKQWTCISDLNRTKPQKTRGGVTLCVSNKNIWSAFKSAILNTQPCDRIIKRF